MDENVIRTICSEMNRYLNNYQMSKLNETLYKRLDSNDNEISNNEYLEKFISSKKLEGCSDLTIRNYNTHIIKLFEYLNKDIRTVDTEDLRGYLSKVHPHKFRRTLATRAIDKGMPIEQVQHLIGHTKIDTTLHYAMVNQNNVKISHRKFIC